MKLRTIELCGFKSFRSKTTLEIGDGITAIVGPNGCGKSNIVDAIRWGLGTQSVRSLRGGAMTDVIFAGSGQRPRAGFAEISLSFEKNESGQAAGAVNHTGSPLKALIAASSSLTVTRRIFKAGDNHYLINGMAVRLKDIEEAFLGTGSGVKGYSIIEQGQIEFLIGARPAERRRFVEELAGVSRYRFNREEAQRKLAATQQNLDRIQDLVAEVTRQVAQLKKQCRITERHLALAEQKKRLQVQLALSRYQTARQQARDLEASVEEATGRHQERQATLALAQAEQAQTAEALRQCEQVVNRHTEELYRHKTRGSLLRQALEHVSHEVGALRAERHRIEEDRAELLQDLERLTLRLEEFDRTLMAQPSLSPRELEELETQLAEAMAVAQSAERQVERIDSDLRQGSAALAQEQTTWKSRSEEISRLKAQNLNRAEREQHLKQATAQAIARRDAATARGVALSEQESPLMARSAEVEERVRLLRLRLDRQREERDAIRQEWSRIEARRQAKAEAAVRDVSEGARQVAQAARNGQIHGVVGILGEGIISPPGQERAVHGALRDLLDAVVVTDELAARQVIGFAEAKGLVLGCVQAKVLTGSDAPVRMGSNAHAPTGSNAHALAGSAPHALVGTPEGSLLASLDLAEWIPDSIRKLLASARPVTSLSRLTGDGPAELWVDPSGNSLDIRGFWRSGDPSGGALARRARWLKELADLDAELQGVGCKQREAEESLATTQEEHQQAVRDERTLVEELQHHRRLVMECENEKTRRSLEIDALTDQLHQLEQSADSQLERIEQLEALKGHSAEQVRLAQERLAELEQARAGARARRDTTRIELLGHQKALADHQALVRQLESQRRALTEERQRIEEQGRRGRERSERLAVRQAEIDSRLEELGKERQENQVQASEADEKSIALDLDVNRARVRLDELKHVFKGRSDSVNTAREASIHLAAEQEWLKASAEQAHEQLEQIETSLLSQHRLSLEQAREWVAGSEAPDDAAEDLDRIEESMAGLGPVNYMAGQELGQAEERYRFLLSQKTDLVKAMDDLRASIDELDKASRLEFMATFEALRHRFEQLFLRLFRGGEATLALTESDDPLEAGVEVFVRPPGKRVRCMSLLSGGEKALAAVALIFSAFQLKPSPFCILDEVDAPLDDVNVEHFIDLIAELSSDTQFLVITHNRVTMESADALIGVTMQEPGCSRLVSVNLPLKRRRRPLVETSPEARSLKLTG